MIDGEERDLLLRLSAEEQLSPKRMLSRLIERHEESSSEERRLRPLFAELNDALDVQLAAIRSGREEISRTLQEIRARNENREATAA